ncbi:MAG: hypothetical protein RL638_1822 [Bacteroidota bacterium]|jgi:hypothetical protein
MRNILLLSLLSWACLAQQPVNLIDLSAFKSPSANWTIEGAVQAAYSDSSFQVATGKGILVNTIRNGKYHRTDDLSFGFSHGDIHLMFDFMLPKKGNSGVYLQSRYEVQLADSWGKKKLNFGDCGGIYERWDDARGKGKEGYEGYAPMQNASKAPGLWQTMEIDFQAPRFDANGKKIQNAIFKKVILNGILIHENIEVLGVTRGAVSTQEVTSAPILVQGDHTQVAFKNIRYETYDKPSVKMGPVTFDYYTGKFTEPVIGSAKAVESGKLDRLTYKVIKAKNDYLIHYKSEIEVPETDEYEFQSYWTGSGVVKVDGIELNQGAHWYSEMVSAKTKLTAGKHQLEVIQIKDFPWGPQALGLYVKRIGSHPVALHERTSLPDPEAVGLIEVKANAEPVFQRSFAFHQGKKKTHVIQVGDPSGMHYSYDLKQGALLHVWRGAFLNATQMWENRGEPQTSEPMGVSVSLDGQFPLVLAHQAQADSTELVYKGFRLKDGRPVFMYQWPAANLMLEDYIRPNASGTGLERTLTYKSTSSMQSASELVLGNSYHGIAHVQPNLIGLQGQSYFVQWDGRSGEVLSPKNGLKQQRIPVQGNEISYQLIW